MHSPGSLKRLGVWTIVCTGRFVEWNEILFQFKLVEERVKCNVITNMRTRCSSALQYPG